MEDLDLKIRLIGDSKGLVGTVKDGKKAIDDLGGSSDKTSRKQKSLSTNMNNTGRAAGVMGSAVRTAQGYILAYLGATTIRSLITNADKWNQLQQRIKTATKATGDYAQVSAELINITKANGAELSASVSLFQSLARASDELGATNNDILTLTSTVQQLGVIGGATTANMQAGLMQFSQAMSAGIVRAEEMNSLLENIPEVAARIAKGMGLTSGELRKAVLEGKILSKDVFDSLLKQAPEIANEFKQIPLTLDRASSKLGTSFDQFIAKLNNATGLTASLASGFDQISIRLDLMSGSASVDTLVSEIQD